MTVNFKRDKKKIKKILRSSISENVGQCFMCAPDRVEKCMKRLDDKAISLYGENYDKIVIGSFPFVGDCGLKVL